MSKFDPGVYKALLRVREARAFDLAGLMMRSYVYMTNIGTITMLTLAGYSFLLAGIVSSVIALATFFITPRVSKLVDERGQSRVVPIAALITVVGICAMLATVSMQGPDWLLVATAVLMGFTPNPQALVRARWTFLIRSGRLGKNAPELRTMFSYEGVLDDIAFMFSPAISIALATAITPIAGMLAGGVAFAVGTAILSASRSTEPTLGWSDALDRLAEDKGGEKRIAKSENAEDKGAKGKGAAVRSKASGAHGVAGSERAEGAAATSRKQAHHEKSVLRTSAVVRVLFVLMMFVGAIYGVFDTSTVALAEELGEPNIASVALMMSGMLSMCMGFVFGMIKLRLPQHVQLVVFATAFGIVYANMALIDSGLTLLLIASGAALFYAPFLIVANATCERAVPGDRITEAITWMNAGLTCGMAFGPTMGGTFIDWWGAAVSFDLGAFIALALAATGLLSYRLLKRNLASASYEEMSKRSFS